MKVMMKVMMNGEGDEGESSSGDTDYENIVDEAENSDEKHGGFENGEDVA